MKRELTFNPVIRTLTGQERFIFGVFALSDERRNGVWEPHIDSYNTHITRTEALRMTTNFMRENHRPSRLEHSMLEIGDIRTAVYFRPEMYERFCALQAPLTVAVIESSDRAIRSARNAESFAIEDFEFNPVARDGDFIYAVCQDDLDIARSVEYMTQTSRNAAVGSDSVVSVNAILTMDSGIHEAFRNLNQAAVVGIMEPREEWREAISADVHDHPGTRFSIGAFAEFVMPEGAQAL